MSLIILGVRGVPASHGGFETFAEYLSLYLVNKGWEVTVYCQESTADFSGTTESTWNGVRRIHIPVAGDGAKATVIFDYLSIKHASSQPGLILTLGYNTALFNLLLRLKGKKNVINMDGIEWKRDKWKWYERAWLYLNERVGCWVGHHLVADHPEIKNHLMTRVAGSKVTMIPYGARAVTDADEARLAKYGLEVDQYAILIARPEPENSILEIVRAFSTHRRRHKLAVLGNYFDDNTYHKQVRSSASDDVVFLGAIYEHENLDALRYYSSLYVHGHTVGGTNPSLVEALGAGQPVLAHDNKFNRWVAGNEAAYFNDEWECVLRFDALLNDSVQLNKMSAFSSARFEESFTWNHILTQYEDLLLKWVDTNR